mgnify:CR=1 FL=1|tara:strand:+ start:279 stop:539 length:261 start_codon:yes stop_codon:yes gene_type:complete
MRDIDEKRTLKGDLTTIINKLIIIEKIVKKDYNINDNLMTVKQIAEYSTLSEMSIRRAVSNQDLKPFKKDGKMLFRISEVDKWLSS